MIEELRARVVADRDDLPDSVRYVAWRWAELLDPATHFSRAACAYIDAMTGLEQFEAVLADYLTGNGSRWPEAVQWMRMLTEILRLDANARAWSGSAQQKLITALTHAIRTVPNKVPPWKKDKVVHARVTSLCAKEIPAFRSALLGASGDAYRRKLTMKVRTVLANPTAPASWPTLDRDLGYLASRLLAEGRDGSTLATELLHAWEQAADLTEILNAFTSVVDRQPHSFAVAVPILGMRRIRQVDPYGIAELNPQSCWLDDPSRDPSDLRAFIAQETGSATPAVVVHIEVEAHDHAGALIAAHERAEIMADHVVAELRLTDVRLGEKALVRCCESGNTRELPEAAAAIHDGRLYSPTPTLELSGSLRLNRLAREAHAPVLGVSLHWVAMEGAANGAPKEAGTFVPPNAGAMMALAAARYQLTASWTRLREIGQRVGSVEWMALEAWLGLPPNKKHVDLTRWLELLRLVRSPGTSPHTVTPGDDPFRAAMLLRRMATDFGPFHQRLVLDTSDRLNNAALLGNWLVVQDTHARLNLQRIRFMRHRALHRADLGQTHAIALRHAARDLNDGVYEVLSHWLPGRQPWQAMRDARNHFDQLNRQWSQQGRQPAILDPERLTAP